MLIRIHGKSDVCLRCVFPIWYHLRLASLPGFVSNVLPHPNFPLLAFIFLASFWSVLLRHWLVEVGKFLDLNLAPFQHFWNRIVEHDNMVITSLDLKICWRVPRWSESAESLPVFMHPAFKVFIYTVYHYPMINLLSGFARFYDCLWTFISLGLRSGSALVIF